MQGAIRFSPFLQIACAIAAGALLGFADPALSRSAKIS